MVRLVPSLDNGKNPTHEEARKVGTVDHSLKDAGGMDSEEVELIAMVIESTEGANFEDSNCNTKEERVNTEPGSWLGAEIEPERESQHEEDVVGHYCDITSHIGGI
ncbi:hypothetical protein U1Q18_012845 [Sarracenia purpurea var. burkii]